MTHRAPLLAALALCACAPSAPPALVIHVAPADEAVARAYAATLPIAPVEVAVSDDPARAARDPRAPSVAVIADLDEPEAYRLERGPDGPIVHGGGPLGIQYGVSALLEHAGFRFHHPARSHVPEAWSLAVPETDDGVLHAPHMARRGLHLHTLHPTEAYFAFLEPSAEHLAEARAILAWIVHNRGDFVQLWLTDAYADGSAELRAHLEAIVDAAHGLGLEIGVSVQLFAETNLQRGYELGDLGVGGEDRLRARLDALDGLGLDAIKISFGEFEGVEPQTFVERLDLAAAEAFARWPEIEITASVHVGDGLRVDYAGETDLLFYFLVRHADPRIVPWIHTVMYYNLFEPTSGAYEHEDFAEHRAYLYARLAAGEPVAYYPESAYWVAFDVSVPTYLPVYASSRFLDLERIEADVEALGMHPLEEHATFSSGWEWGYWQTDTLILRRGFEVASLEAATRAMLAPHEGGAEAAEAALEVGAIQHEALIRRGLGPYLAGRDVTLDAGFERGIVAAPDRVTFETLRAMEPDARAAFEADVVAPLEALADATEAAAARVGPSTDPFVAEIRDGLEVDVLRARFVAALYRAVLADAAGEPVDAALADAAVALDAAEHVVARRHADLHDPTPRRLTARRISTSTLYQYGYLREAHTLCYWTRERAQVENLLLDAGARVPGCVL